MSPVTLSPVTLTALGHPEIAATDTRTIEVVERAEFTARAGVIGYDANYDPAALAALRGRVRITIAAGGASDVFEATVWPLVHQRQGIVFAREPAVRPRVFAGMASKAAADLDPRLKAALRAAGPVTLTLTPLGGEMPPGALYVVAMPLGNQGDLSPRAMEVLSGVDLILAEDTRVAHEALAWRGIHTPVKSCFDHNERARAPLVERELAAGRRLALISDAGMPLVSDPGHVVTRAAIAAGAHVTVVPGPSAPLAALALSGLPAATFRFAGFPPRTQGRRAAFLDDAVASADTTLAFEAPQRIGALLAELAALAPEREIALCRDLTKRTERVWRGTAQTVAGEFAVTDDGRGEFTLVIAPREEEAAAAAPEGGLEDFVAELLRAGCPTNPIVTALRARGMSRGDAYALVQRLKP
jgi:16S rRNA (cytidine1402-2'-O)-methyltransferase